MDTKFKALKQAQPGVKGGGQYLYYARVCDREIISLNEVCEKISASSTFSQPDIIGAISAFLEVIPEYLKQGRIVNLGEFGIFSQSIRSKPAFTEKELTSKNITGLKVLFRPGTDFKKKMKNATFTKVVG